MEASACSTILFALAYSWNDFFDKYKRYLPYIRPGIIKKISVGKATNDNLHEKYVQNTSPDKNTDVCIKNFGTYNIAKQNISNMVIWSSGWNNRSI